MRHQVISGSSSHTSRLLLMFYHLRYSMPNTIPKITPKIKSKDNSISTSKILQGKKKMVQENNRKATVIRKGHPCTLSSFYITLLYMKFSIKVYYGEIIYSTAKKRKTLLKSIN